MHISNYSFTLHSRRFLQELFLDVDFQQVRLPVCSISLQRSSSSSSNALPNSSKLIKRIVLPSSCTRMPRAFLRINHQLTTLIRREAGKITLPYSPLLSLTTNDGRSFVGVSNESLAMRVFRDYLVQIDYSLESSKMLTTEYLFLFSFLGLI